MASVTQDFNTYTKTDPSGRFTVIADKVTATGLLGNDAGHYVYKDMGVGHFNEDFTHHLESFKSTVTQYGITTVWAISNNIDDYQGHVDNSYDGVFLLNSGPTNTTNQFIFRVVENGSMTQDFTGSLPEDTLYYITIERDDDGGVNNTGRYTCYIRTGSHVGTLVDTLVVDSGAGEQNDFRYIYALAGPANGAVSHEADGYTQNLHLNEPDAGNYEDFTTYTETDPGGTVTVTAPKVSWDDLDRSTETHVIGDYGVDHFNEDFTHNFEFQWSDKQGNGASPWFWVLANVEKDITAILNDGDDAIAINKLSSDHRFYLYHIEDGSASNSDLTDFNAVEGTTYFFTCTRDYDGGSNNTGLYTVDIRVGSHEGPLVDTISVEAGVGEQNDYRYLYAVDTAESSTGTSDGFFQNLDINEIVLPEGIFINNFNLGVGDWTLVSDLGSFSVDAIDRNYSIDITASGSYFLHNGEQVSTTFSGIDDGQIMSYTPASVVSSGTFTITAHVKNINNDIKEETYYLLYGYNVLFDQVVEWGPAKQVDVLIQATNLAFCPNTEGEGSYFKTIDLESRSLGAIVRVIEPFDLNSTIYPQSTAFFYGKTYTVTVSGVKDFSSNEMDPYTFNFTIEDPTS